MSAARVAAALAACGVYDPRGVNTPESIAAGGQCFELVTPGGTCAFVIRVDDEATWWIDGAAAGQSAGITQTGLDLVEFGARATGARFVAFETARRGLVRLAQRAGYVITEHVPVRKGPYPPAPAWVLRKALPC